jgi:UDP-N-acetylmuramyl pentapeptide synthase
MSEISEEISSHFDCICFESSHKAERKIPDMIKNNDLVLIKGSNGMNLNLITAAIINFFKKLKLNNNIHTKEQNYAV